MLHGRLQLNLNEIISSQEFMRDNIINTTLRLTSQNGWKGFSMLDIAKGCDMPFAELLEWFSDKTDVLIAYGRSVDLQACSDVRDVDVSLAVKDRVFEILMARFDVISDNKDAVTSILKDLKCDPVSAFTTFPHLTHSMRVMLEHGGVRVSGVRGSLWVYALAVCYISTLRVWVNDDSVDLSKTMAALDKNLGYFERICS